jgi:enoyl-CoA hydratase/carnithine racemase
VNAIEAEKLSLVTKVVDLNELDKEVHSLVNEFLEYSPSAISLGLEAFDVLKRIPVSDAHIHMKQMLGECLQTEDAAEGMKAFIEKRKPVWKGQ